MSISDLARLARVSLKTVQIFVDFSPECLPEFFEREDVSEYLKRAW